MATSDPLQARARWAYERGRLLRGVRTATWTAPFLAGALLLGLPAFPCCTLAGVIGLMLVAFVWVGRGLQAGIGAGLLAGALPFGASLLLRAGYGGTPDCVVPFELCFLATSLGGAAAGLLIARRAQRERARWRRSFIAGAAALAVCIGSLGCALFLFPGAVGVIAGVALVGTPAFFAAPWAAAARDR